MPGRLVLAISFSMVTLSGACASAEKVADKAVDVAACRAKQQEAIQVLSALQKVQDQFEEQRKTYAETVGDLDFGLEEQAVYYAYSVVEVTKKGYRMRAKAIDKEMKGDTWEITKGKPAENTKDGCGG